MMNMNNKEFEMMKAMGKDVMEKLNAGEKLVDVLAGIYVENLEDKSFEQGLVMAEAAIEAVREFDAEYAAAQENLNNYVDSKMEEMESGKSIVEMCNFWKDFIAAVAAVNLQAENKDAVAEAEACAKSELAEDEATQEMLDELREQAKEAIMNNGHLTSYLLHHSDEISAMAEGDETARMIMSIGGDEEAYRAILTMIAYTQVKNGELENVPSDWTMGQIAVAVCTEQESVKIAEAVESGNLMADVAAGLLMILGSVAIFKLVSYAVAVGFVVAGVMIGELGVFPLVLGALVLWVWGVSKGINAWIDACPAIGKKIVYVGGVVVKAVVSGIKKLIAFVKETVIPGIVTVAEKVLNFVRNLVNGKKENEAVVEGHLVTEA